MSAWLFIFGRSTDLSYAELCALASFRTKRITADVALGETDEKFVPEALIGKLGGVVKIALVKGRVDDVTPQALAGFLDDTDGPLTFGVSLYGTVGHIDTRILKQIKEIFSQRHISSRYVSSHEGNTLSSVVVAKAGVRELVVAADGEDGYVVGETAAVQDFAGWNERDYGRPCADPKSGMLPPKVARMAVNIAGEPKVLLDPFCGMGTIVAEASLAGWIVTGSDQSPDVVRKAEKNIEWLAKKYAFSRPSFLVSDATQISRHVPEHSVSAIVTEPFLGRMTDATTNVGNIVKGLEKLYIGCLRDWHGILKDRGKVVIALPEYAVGRRTYFVKNVIDKCENLGYTVSQGPLTYAREHAVVRRKFFVLTKK